MPRWLGVSITTIVAAAAATGYFMWQRGRSPTEPPWREALRNNEVVRLSRQEPPRAPTIEPPGPVEAERFLVPPPPVLPGGEAPVNALPRSAPAPSADGRSPHAAAADVVTQCQDKLAKLKTYSGVLEVEEFGETGPLPKQAIQVRADRTMGKVLFEWTAGPMQGRRIVFDSRRPQIPVSVRLGPNEAPTQAPPLALRPEHPLVRSSLRNPLPRYGLEGWTDWLARIVRALDRDDRRYGTLIRLPPVLTPTDTGRASVVLRQQADTESTHAGLPAGGRRDWFIDSEIGLPLRVVARRADGALLEQNQMRDLKFDVAFDEKTFIVP